MLLSLTSNVGEISGTYPGQDTRGPSTPFAVVQDEAREGWQKAAGDFLRGAGIGFYADANGVRVVDRYKSDAATPDVPFYGAGGGASWLSSPIVLVGAGVLAAFLLLRKR